MGSIDMATTLKQIRADIGKLQKEIKLTERAVRPLAETEQQLRRYLATLANSHSRLIEYSAHALNTGDVYDLTPAPVLLPEAAYGLAISALGIDTIVEQAKARAAAEDTGALRMSDESKAARLLGLSRELYALEIEEAGLLNGECPRSDMNAAAAVGIPVDVAEHFGLLLRKV